MAAVAGFKHVGFITRKQGQSFDAFVKHWNEVHTEIALRLPGWIRSEPHRSGKIPRLAGGWLLRTVV